MSMVRTAGGSIRKENPQVTENYEANIVKLRTAVSRAQIMQTLKDHPGWKSIQDVLTERIKALDSELDNFKKKEHRENDLLMQERKDLRSFVSIVDDFTQSIDGFEQAIGNLEKALSERKERSPL